MQRAVVCKACLLVALAFTAAGADTAQAAKKKFLSAAWVAQWNRMTARGGPYDSCAAGDCDTAPVLLVAEVPRYPRELERQAIQGQAILSLVIDETGHAIDIRVVSATEVAFGESAAAAMANWQFRPATKGGIPIRLECRQTIPFELGSRAGVRVD
jgi:TonB family protein